MIHLVSALFGAVFTVVVALAAGKLLLRALGLEFHRHEEHVFAFLTGAACLSLAVFVLAALHWVTPMKFLLLGGATVAAALISGAHRPRGQEPPSSLPRRWKVAFGVLFGIWATYYFATALAPETSPDGSGYHLGLVRRYFEAGGFFKITTNMYAMLSAGGEMLFLFAFAFGRHSSAALTHFAFYLTLPFAMLCYARRFRFPMAGAAGALLVAMAPAVAHDGAVAYIDVALACVLFGVFYLLQIWDRERAPALLVPIGLLAGFAYAIKYTGFVAVLYAVGFVLWKLLPKRQNPARAVAVIGLCALLMVAPWMLKNLWYVGNPLAPFYNRVFPNPYTHVGFERQYRNQLANWGEVKSKLEIPLEVTVRGARLQGLLGPAFLLLPLGLLALRRREGRQLLLAAGVFALTYPANIGTRFLIPMLPFASLALAMVLAEWRWATPALLAFHALTTWPPNLVRYCELHAFRIERFPWEAALRWESENDYLARALPDVAVSRLLDTAMHPDSKVLVYSAPPESYTSRDILVSYQGALNQNLTELISTAKVREWQPTRRYTFKFEAQPVRRLRVVQAGRASNPDEYWAISELRVFNAGREVPREPQWRITSEPNRWESPMAFDNNPMTRWRSWEGYSPGMFLEVNFRTNQRLDSVVVETTPDHHGSRIWLEGWMADGRQVQLSLSPETADVPPPANMRRWVASEIRRNGVEYLLIRDDDWVAEDLRDFRGDYGISEIAALNGFRLYRID